MAQASDGRASAIAGPNADFNACAVAIGQYTRTLTAEEESRLNPRIIATQLGVSLREVVAVLEVGVARGLLRRWFHFFCPTAKAGLRWLDSLAMALESYECDLCDDGPHALTADEIEVRYALAAVATTRASDGSE